MLSSNEVYYTDESAQGKNFFKKFSDLVIGLVIGTFLNDQSFKNVHYSRNCQPGTISGYD